MGECAAAPGRGQGFLQGTWWQDQEAEAVATRPAEFPRCAPVPVLHSCRLAGGMRVSFQVPEALRVSESVLSCGCVYSCGFGSYITSGDLPASVSPTI